MTWFQMDYTPIHQARMAHYLHFHYLESIHLVVLEMQYTQNSTVVSNKSSHKIKFIVVSEPSIVEPCFVLFVYDLFQFQGRVRVRRP
jgi:hypothetical protein